MRIALPCVAAFALFLHVAASGQEAPTPVPGPAAGTPVAAEPLAAPQAAPAQAADLRSEVALSPVVATPVQRDQQLFESPRSIASIDRTEVGRRAPASTPDVVGAEPGVFLQKTNVGAGAPIIRGMIGPRNLIVVDGIRVNNSTYRTGPNQYLSLIDPTSASRIEVMRGPGSVLYGSDALGGVIQIITPEPRLYPLEMTDLELHAMGRVASAEASAGGRVAVNASAVGVGLVAGATARDAGDLRAGKGFSQPLTAFDEGFADMKMSARLGPGVATGMYQRARIYNVDRTDAAPTGNLTTYDNARDLAYLAYKARVPFAESARLTLSFHRQREDRHIRTYSDPEDPSKPGPVDPGNLEAASLKQDALESDSVHTWGGALMFTSAALAGRMVLTYGADFYRDYVYSEASFRPGGATAYQPRSRGAFSDGSRYTNGGLYLLAEWTPLEFDRGALTVFAGARGTDVRAFAAGVPLGGEPQEVRYKRQTASLAGGLSASFGDSLFAAASANQGIRAPNLAETTVLGDTGSTFEIPNPGLRPERATTVELLLRYARPRASVEVAGYYTDLSGPIVRVDSEWEGQSKVGGKRVVQRVNGGRGRIAGAEASARVVLSPRAEAYGQFTYTFGEDERDGEVAPATRIPPPFGALGLRVHVRRERPTLAVDGVVRGAFDQRRRISPEDKKDLRIGPDGTPGWVAVDARLSSEVTETIRFSAAVENLFDRMYKTHGSGSFAPGFNAVGQAEVKF